MSASQTRPGEGWTRVVTPHGRFEYQFQRRSPTVRSGQYEDAADYQFLLLDAGGWLIRIPVCISSGVESSLRQQVVSQDEALYELIRVAAAQLCAGLQKFPPRRNAPFEELDQVFSLNLGKANNPREDPRKPTP